MEPLQRVAITVQQPKRRERFELQAGELRVGSAAHCDIRLAPGEAALEQLALRGDARGLWVINTSPEPPVLLDDQPLTRRLVTDRARIEIGPALLQVELLAAQPKPAKRRVLFKRARQLALLIAIVPAYLAATYQPEARSALERTLPAPELFAGAPRPACAYGEPPIAQAAAEEQLMAADAQRERYPFDASEGVRAVAHYELAGACFARAGAPERAARAQRERDQLARALQEDLRAHQAQLEWSLARRRYDVTARAVRALQALLVDRDDAHAQWIDQLARALQAVPRTDTRGPYAQP